MYVNANRHPLLHSIANDAEWITEDEFPAPPEWADEHERWLAFVDAGELARFLPRLKKSAYQRGTTFSEIGSACNLENHRSVPIIDWEPSGNGGKKGEYMVQGPTVAHLRRSQNWWLAKRHRGGAGKA